MNKLYFIFSCFMFFSCNHDDAESEKSILKLNSSKEYDFFNNEGLGPKLDSAFAENHFEYKDASEIIYFHNQNPFLKFINLDHGFFKINLYWLDSSQWIESDRTSMKAEKDFIYISYLILEERFYVFKLDNKLNLLSLILIQPVEISDEDYCIEPTRFFSFETSKNQSFLIEHELPRVDIKCSIDIRDAAFYFKACEKFPLPVIDTVNRFINYDNSWDIFEDLIIEHDPGTLN